MTNWDPYSIDHFRIEMDKWEIAQAIDVGGRRLVANLGRGDAKHYDRSRMESDLIAQPAAVLCEAAVAKWLGVYYDWSAWDSADHGRHRHRPDVGGFEVRRVRTSPNVAVRRRDFEKNVDIAAAYVDTDQLDHVLVFGWVPIEIGWEHGQPSHYDPEGTRLYPVAHMNPHIWETAHVLSE